MKRRPITYFGPAPRNCGDDRESITNRSKGLRFSRNHQPLRSGDGTSCILAAIGPIKAG
jgi:hypothetical protein